MSLSRNISTLFALATITLGLAACGASSGEPIGTDGLDDLDVNDALVDSTSDDDATRGDSDSDDANRLNTHCSCTDANGRSRPGCAPESCATAAPWE